MKQLTIFGFFTLLMVMSCTKTIEPDVSASAPDLVVLAELEIGMVEPLISLRSTFDNNLIEGDWDQTINVDAYVNDDEIGINFRPLDGDLNVWKAPPQLVIENGNTYRIYIDASEFGFPVTEATTEAPLAAQFLSNEVGTPELVTTSNGFDTEFESTFQIESATPNEGYYHVTPYLKKDDGSKLYLDVKEVLQNENAVMSMEHRHGILIDESLISESNMITTVLSLSQNIDNIDLESDNIYIELRTVTEDYFKYHRSVSLNVQSSSSPFTLPTLTYTNFSNGYGLFSIYATQLDSIAF